MEGFEDKLNAIGKNIQALRIQQCVLIEEHVNKIREQNPLLYVIREKATPTTPKCMMRGAYKNDYGCFDSSKAAFVSLSRFVSSHTEGYNTTYSIEPVLSKEMDNDTILRLNKVVYPSFAHEK